MRAYPLERILGRERRREGGGGDFGDRSPRHERAPGRRRAGVDRRRRRRRTRATELTDVACVTSTRCFAVGYRQNGDEDRALIEHGRRQVLEADEPSGARRAAAGELPAAVERRVRSARQLLRRRHLPELERAAHRAHPPLERQGMGAHERDQRAAGPTDESQQRCLPDAQELLRRRLLPGPERCHQDPRRALDRYCLERAGFAHGERTHDRPARRHVHLGHELLRGRHLGGGDEHEAVHHPLERQDVGRGHQPRSGDRRPRRCRARAPRLASAARSRQGRRARCSSAGTARSGRSCR